MKTDNEKYNESVQSNTFFLENLKSKLPDFFSKDGKFDLDKFKSQLQEHNIDELKDGYQLNFIGKDYARRQAGEMPNTVIVPDEIQNNGEGKNSKNLFFTGDNLEVLRHLQTNYAGKVDVIYIDPPYNTGNDDFVYPDRFEYSDEKLKEMFGMGDEQVERLKSIQGKSSHSAWMTFMYPRLLLAKNILSNNGVIFISIDDNEQANLKMIMDNIFGESQFLFQAAWRRTDNQPNNGQVAKVKEYILVYAKDGFEMGRLPLSESALKEYRYEDSYAGKFRRGILLHKTRGRYYYPVTTKSGNILNGPWMVPEDKLWEMDRNNQIYWTSGGDEQPYKKIYLKNSKGAIPNDFWGIEFGTNQRASSEIEELLKERFFSFPKPTSLIKRIINLGGDRDSLILDFFAGSSTTADAVMQLNAEDGGRRKFIMVQLPEKTYTVNSDGKELSTKGGKVAYDAGFKAIDEISRERIRRAAAKIQEDNNLPEDFDGSFKHYRVVEPTKQTLEEVEDFDINNTDLFNDMVSSFSSDALNVAGNASGEQTIRTTWLAKDGYSFDADVKKVDFAGYEASLVEGSRLYLINDGWTSKNTEDLLNKLGTHQLTVQTIVLFGYSFNIAELRELEIGLKQLDVNINLLKRY